MTQETPLEEALGALQAGQGKHFWRALDALVDRPDFLARLAERFPALATGPGDWRRRDLLKCMGGALALAGLDGCERSPDEEALPYVVQPEDEVPGIARFYATAVELDGVAQPVIGKTRAARPIKLEGNPDHPASRGASDAFTQAALLGLYDPDRSAGPRRLNGPTQWDEVDSRVAQLRRDLDASGGVGFRLLTGRVGSPTLRRQIAALRKRWPNARWHEHAPVVAPPAERFLHLDQAHVLVCFDEDPLGPGPRQLWHASSWAARRRAYQAGDGEASLFVAEPTPTLTGVTAGERLVAGGARMEPLMTALAAQLGLGGEASPLNSRERAWIDAVVERLVANRGRGLVLVGAEQPVEVRRTARAINAALGNLGVTQSSVEAETVRPEPLAPLLAAMASRQVGTLVVLESNPAYTLPGFVELLAKVPLRIHAGLHADETAEHCHWHWPLSHALESWSDGRAADGTAVLTQPLVRPWLAVRSRHALLAALLDDDAGDRKTVQATWPALDQAGWEKALLTGSVPGEARVRTAASEVTTGPSGKAVEHGGLTLIIRPDPSVWDGSLASNPWLQECPKPLTKLTWGNAVHIAPALAAELKVANGDLLRVATGERHVTAPVWIMPGQDRRTVLVHLGGGRRTGSRVAKGVGFDAYGLTPGPVHLARADGREELATTQLHFAMEDEEFVRFVQTAADKLPPEPPKASFYERQVSSPAWGMAIDLDLCIGCNACVVACVAENNIPMVGKDQVAMGREMHWLRVDRYYQGPPEDPKHSFQPVPCMHCEDAPCEMGCPVNATVHSPDGLNLQVYNRCIGTRTCSAYCPYKVRRFNWFDLTEKDPPELRAARNPEVTVRGRGVMEKCTYCIQRISAARIGAKKEDRDIRDGEVVTACQAACPTKAIVFGDVSDPATAVRRRKDGGRDYDLLREANTRPRTTYQARIQRGTEDA